LVFHTFCGNVLISLVINYHLMRRAGIPGQRFCSKKAGFAPRLPDPLLETAIRRKRISFSPQMEFFVVKRMRKEPDVSLKALIRDLHERFGYKTNKDTLAHILAYRIYGKYPDIGKMRRSMHGPSTFRKKRLVRLVEKKQKQGESLRDIEKKLALTPREREVLRGYVLAKREQSMKQYSVRTGKSGTCVNKIVKIIEAKLTGECHQLLRKNWQEGPYRKMGEERIRELIVRYGAESRKDIYLKNSRLAMAAREIGILDEFFPKHEEEGSVEKTRAVLSEAKRSRRYAKLLSSLKPGEKKLIKGIEQSKTLGTKELANSFGMERRYMCYLLRVLRKKLEG